MSAPSFNLAACPRCSSFLGGLTKPFWKYAHNTSAARGLNCYFWVPGCGHAAPAAPDNVIFQEQADFDRIEAKWRAIADETFATQTAGWTVAQRERWAAMLADRQHVEGTTRALDLSPDPSGPTKTQTNKDHHGHES